MMSDAMYTTGRPDFILRPEVVQLMWSSYSEAVWPDFTRDDLDAAVAQ
ncbi:hypothetical protein [Faecalibacterium hattorii]